MAQPDVDVVSLDSRRQRGGRLTGRHRAGQDLLRERWAVSWQLGLRFHDDQLAVEPFVAERRRRGQTCERPADDDDAVEVEPQRSGLTLLRWRWPAWGSAAPPLPSCPGAP